MDAETKINLAIIGLAIIIPFVKGIFEDKFGI
jgi:hypothetical protein